MEERLNMERSAASGTNPSSLVANEELGHILDEELARLPTKLHVAIVLCDLEGLSQKQAATQLGIAPSTVNDRVQQGRRQLRDRLVRRGATLTLAGLATCVASSGEASASLCPTFIADTSAKAALYVAGKSAAEVGVAITAAQSTNLVTWTLTKAKLITVLVLAALGIAAWVGASSGIVGTRQDTVTAAPLIYAFIQDHTNDVLAIMEFSKLPATHADVVSLTFTDAGDEIFGFGTTFDDVFSFSRGALDSDGATGLVSTIATGGGVNARIRNDTSSIHNANALLVGTSTPGGPVDLIGLARTEPGAFFVKGRFEQVTHQPRAAVTRLRSTPDNTE